MRSGLGGVRWTEEETNGATGKKLTGNITHLMIVEHRFALFVTRHVHHWGLAPLHRSCGIYRLREESRCMRCHCCILEVFLLSVSRERGESEGKERRAPLQLIPSQPSLHSHDLPSSRKRRWSPSASESHSVSR